ncbi:MAG: hypothetical protein QUT30_08155 [Acidobacteriota bacterium]|jgi:hypothetical protein|nr:hypothetical protein [Acidobacteriota bacterium]
MYIKVELVTRDKDNPLDDAKAVRETIRTHYDVNTGEAIVTDRICIDSYTYDIQKQQLHVVYRLGGIRSDGSISIDPQFSAQRYSFSKKMTQDIWNQIGLGDPATIDIHNAIHMLLIAERPAIQTVARAAWGMPKLEGRLIDDAGKVVDDYKTQISALRISRA